MILIRIQSGLVQSGFRAAAVKHAAERNDDLSNDVVDPSVCRCVVG